MAMQTATAEGTLQGMTVEQKVQELKKLYADAPELGRVAFERGLDSLKRELAAATGAQTAGRIGARQGKVR